MICTLSANNENGIKKNVFGNMNRESRFLEVNYKFSKYSELITRNCDINEN